MPKLGRMEAMTPAGIPEFTVADRLRKAREKTGLDHRQFASAIDSSKGTISNYESNRYTRQRKTIVLKAWALRTGVPLEWILTGQEPQDGGDGTPRIIEESSFACTSRPGLRLAA